MSQTKHQQRKRERKNERFRIKTKREKEEHSNGVDRLGLNPFDNSTVVFKRSLHAAVVQL